MLKFTLVMTLMLILGGCIKTAEQVRREQRLENMSKQMEDSQGLMADLTTTLRDLQSQIDKLNGRVEELEHKQAGLDPQAIAGMTEESKLTREQITAMQKNQDEQKAQLTAIQEDLKSQRTFIEKVTQSLGAMKSSGSTQKKSAKEIISKVEQMIGRKEYTAAKSMVDEALASESNPSDVNKLYYSAGRIEFARKNWQESLVYFSKIYTKYPRSSLAAGSLFHIGQGLKELGKSAEAKQAFEEFQTQYPKSSFMKEVEQALKTL